MHQGSLKETVFSSRKLFGTFRLAWKSHSLWNKERDKWNRSTSPVRGDLGAVGFGSEVLSRDWRSPWIDSAKDYGNQKKCTSHTRFPSEIFVPITASPLPRPSNFANSH